MTPPNIAVHNWIRQAFDFQGRSTRSDYWWPRLLVFTVNFVLLSVFVTALGPDRTQALLDWLASGSTDLAMLDIGPMPSAAKFSLTSMVVFGVLTFIPDLSISWRRFHDLRRPGWLHIIFLFASALSPIFMVAQYIWFAFPGTTGANRYGPDRLDPNPGQGAD